jgi:hypothetical protein
MEVFSQDVRQAIQGRDDEATSHELVPGLDPAKVIALLVSQDSG